MNPTSILISIRILQSTDTDTFNGIPETSLSPLTAAVGPNTSAAARRLLDPTAPFDSSMALTILILLTALFFLAFFSVYIRRSSAATAAAAEIAPPFNPPKGGGGGLDSSAVNSLPLVAYGRAAKHPMIEDCPICLSEFSERDTVKLIPYCCHVFHPSCLDTWLASHVTCPLCRSAQLFKRVEEVCLNVAHDMSGVRAPEIGERSTAENRDAWHHRASDGVRRTCSCSNLTNRAVLQRSTSF